MKRWKGKGTEEDKTRKMERERGGRGQNRKNARKRVGKGNNRRNWGGKRNENTIAEKRKGGKGSTTRRTE